MTFDPPREEWELLSECTLYLAKHYGLSVGRLHKLLLKETAKRPRGRPKKTRNTTIGQWFRGPRKPGRPKTVTPYPKLSAGPRRRKAIKRQANRQSKAYQAM